MTPRKFLTGAALSAMLSFSPCLLAEPNAAPRPGDAIVAKFEAMERPQFDRSKQDDQAYRQEYSNQVMAFMQQQAELARELWDADPTHPQAMKMMQNRWRVLVQTGKTDDALAEIDAALASVPAERKPDLDFTKAQLTMTTSHGDPAKAIEAADAFAKAYPADARAGDLLVMAAGSIDDQDKALALYRRVASDYPTARSAAQAKGKIRQIDGIGKPFELSFTDAITGKPVSHDSLRGKVVVVDFWATWCGPCIAEMPHMKEIYAKYKDKGVEFVGISLDQPEAQGGLEKLKAYCKENDIQWPQFYQGNGWQSEFSSSWGINSIPALFVVDQNGNLFSVNARGQVEQLIQKLLGEEKPERVGG